jgi:hypothetical protein
MTFNAVVETINVLRPVADRERAAMAVVRYASRAIVDATELRDEAVRLTRMASVARNLGVRRN